MTTHNTCCLLNCKQKNLLINDQKRTWNDEFSSKKENVWVSNLIESTKYNWTANLKGETKMLKITKVQHQIKVQSLGKLPYTGMGNSPIQASHKKAPWLVSLFIV